MTIEFSEEFKSSIEKSIKSFTETNKYFILRNV